VAWEALGAQGNRFSGFVGMEGMRGWGLCVEELGGGHGGGSSARGRREQGEPASPFIVEWGAR
jgi:hypothetical protein